MHRRPEVSAELFLVAIFCILAPTLLACAPKAPPLEAGLPTGYELLEGREAEATSFEMPPTEIDAAEVLPTRLLSGPHHAVRGARLDHGFMYVFDVESEYGQFEVTGTALLRKRAIELEALAQLREEQPGMAQLFAYEDEFFVTNGLVMAHTVDGAVVLPLYMDHGYWTSEVAQSEREIDRFLEWDRDVERKHLLISGEISQRARRELEARHWDVSEHIEDRSLSQIDIAKYQPPTDAEGRRILPELGR